MITVISKHLRLFYNRYPVSDGEFLGAIHYIEQLRYHAHRFMLLSSGNSKTPDDFDPGIGVSGDELDHLYSKMAMWFELESFVKTSRSFLDHLWRIAAKNHPYLSTAKDIRNQKYMLKAFYELKISDCEFKESNCYIEIEKVLSAWGRYLIGFRNYSEYSEPLGGMLSSAIGSLQIRVVDSSQSSDICLPDNFPSYNENPESFIFTYEKRNTAREFIPKVLDDIDTCFNQVILDIHNTYVSPSK